MLAGNDDQVKTPVELIREPFSGVTGQCVASSS